MLTSPRTFSATLIGSLLLTGAPGAIAGSFIAAHGSRAAGEAYMTQGAGFAHDVRIARPQPFRLIAPPPPEPVFDARHTGEAYATTGDREARVAEDPVPTSAYASRRARPNSPTS